MTFPEQLLTWLRYGLDEASRVVRILGGWAVHLGGYAFRGVLNCRLYAFGGSNCGRSQTGVMQAPVNCVQLSCGLQRSCMLVC